MRSERKAQEAAIRRMMRWLLTGVVLCLIALASAAQAETPSSSREATEEIIREYLLRHPEVIVESLRLMQEREREAAARRTRDVIVTRRQELLHDPDSPVGGNPQGDVTVVEFFDYRCPHCQRMAPVVKQLVSEDPKLRVVYKEFPILGEDSHLAARAGLAARAQGKYVAFHDALMSATRPLTRANILAIASAIGLDPSRLQADMETPALGAVLERDYALAQAMGIDATPAFVVGTELVIGATDLETLKALVTRARRGE